MTVRIRDKVEDFFSMLEAEVKYNNYPTIQCIFPFGSYTRKDSFNDIDIMTLLADRYDNTEQLIKDYDFSRKRFEIFKKEYRR